MSNEPHKHIFKDIKPKKIPLYNETSGISGYDMMKLRKCECGKTQAYEVERTKL